MKNKVDGYKRLLSYLKPYKKLLILSVFFYDACLPVEFSCSLDY